jgi:phosphoribosylglycinamide formyltransferase-1
LLPSFPGLEAWRQALDYGVKVTGCTVHLVDQGIDTGPILAQRAVPVLDGDTAPSLHARIQEAERLLYPEVIGAWARDEIRVKGRVTQTTSL